MSVRGRGFALALGALLLLQAGCQRRDAAPQSRHPGELVVAMQQEPIALDPLLLEGPAAYAVGELFYSYLTNYDADGNVIPDLALQVPTPESGGVTDGGKRITFHLRHGIRWQDGAPLTARDVVFTYDAIVNPKNLIPSRYGYDRIARCWAPDAYTVVIELNEPFAPIVPQFLGGDSNYPILPAHLLGNYPNVNKLPFNESPVGSGPYELARWAHGDRLELTANPGYYLGKPAIPRIVLPFVHDPSTIVNELLTGEIDAAFSLDASRIALLRKLPGHRTIVTPIPYFYAISFNTTDPLLRDAAVRRALALAIDRDTIVRKVSHGVYDPRTGLRGLFTWAFDARADRIAYDPQLAKQLLHGRHLELQLAFPAGSVITEQLATAIAAAESAIGVTVTLKRYNRDVYMVNDGPIMQGRYQMQLYDYHSNYDPDASWLVACNQRAPNGFNIARYCDRSMDRALLAAASVFERSRRARLYSAIQARLMRDLPYFFLGQASEIDVIPATLQQYDRPLLSPFNSVARWSLAGGSTKKRRR